MKKLNFKQPKYIIPIVLLPALFIFNYIAYGYVQKHQRQTIQTLAIDSTMINPSIDEQNKQERTISDKFSAVTNEFKETKDSSAMQNIQTEQLNKITNSMNGTEKNKRFMDSVKQSIVSRNNDFEQKMKQSNAAIARAQAMGNGGGGNQNYNSRKANEGVELQHMLDQLQAQKNGYGQPTNATTSASGKRSDLDEFRQQMIYLDSLQQSHNPANRKLAAEKAELKKQQFIDTIKPLPVEKASSINMAKFNTVYRNKDQNFIQAIIDQSTQSFNGSRVRLRLLDDIDVGGELISKGTYLYAFVTGFAAQRIFLSVTSINKNSSLLPVKLTIYDNDGLSGLYVPSSKFRDFSKELGAGSASTLQYSSQSSSTSMTDQIEQGLITRLFSGTSSAVSKLLKDNKALVKYSTIVYLIPTKQ